MEINDIGNTQTSSALPRTESTVTTEQHSVPSIATTLYPTQTTSWPSITQSVRVTTITPTATTELFTTDPTEGYVTTMKLETTTTDDEISTLATTATTTTTAFVTVAAHEMSTLPTTTSSLVHLTTDAHEISTIPTKTANTDPSTTQSVTIRTIKPSAMTTTTTEPSVYLNTKENPRRSQSETTTKNEGSNDTMGKAEVTKAITQLPKSQSLVILNNVYVLDDI